MRKNLQRWWKLAAAPGAIAVAFGWCAWPVQADEIVIDEGSAALAVVTESQAEFTAFAPGDEGPRRGPEGGPPRDEGRGRGPEDNRGRGGPDRGPPDARRPEGRGPEGGGGPERGRPGGDRPDAPAGWRAAGWRPRPAG